MTTKEQEKKALEQIKKIIDGLGVNSYIGIAMEGMIEDAEYNIENDFACSMKGRVDSLEARLRQAEVEREHFISVKDHLQKKLEESEKNREANWNSAHDHAMESKEKDKQIAELQAKLDSQKAEFNEAIADKDNLLAKRDFEVMQLKAKLYDLMNQ